MDIDILSVYYSLMNNVESPGTHPYPAIGRLLGAAHSIEARADAELAAVGLSLAKVGLLRHLAESKEPLPLTALSERCGCVKSNITQLVDRLEADGLVQRMPDPEDRRCIRAGLTDLGRSRVVEGLAVLSRLDATVSQALKDGSWERGEVQGIDLG